MSDRFESINPVTGVLTEYAGGSLSDATSNPNTELVGALDMQFNGTNWERHTGNLELTVLASAARTTTTNSSDLSNFNCRGAHIVIDATALAATPSVVFTVQGKDAVSGKYFTVLTSAAIVATGTTTLTVYPGITAAANVAVAMVLPRTWRVVATAGDADSLTYSVGAMLVV